jgi:hypothetical protein
MKLKPRKLLESVHKHHIKGEVTSMSAPFYDERLQRIENHLGLPTYTPTTPDPKPDVPAPQLPAPTGVKATVDASRRVKLSWNAVEGATGYEVHELLTDPSRTLKATVLGLSRLSGSLSGSAYRYGVKAKNATTTSPLSETVLVDPRKPTSSTPTPAPTPGPTPGGRYPSSVLDLRNWKLTLPLTVDGKVKEILQPGLATYSDRHFSLTDAGDGARLRVWHGGGTTQNSNNPRTELREMQSDGVTKSEWSTTSGRHVCEIVGQVNRLTKVKPHVVIGQIHGGDDDVTVFRVEGTKLYITDGDNNHGFLLDDNFRLGQRYKIGFDVSGGVIRYIYNDVEVPFTLRSADSTCYFKAGNYLQSNPGTAPGESTEEYSEVVLYSVKVSHS